ncbi:MAG: hypothetical protein ABMB14_11595 [Myxococcota bacterium]
MSRALFALSAMSLVPTAAHALCGPAKSVVQTFSIVPCVGCVVNPSAHYAGRPTLAPGTTFQPHLVVYLPGGNSQPAASREIVRTAAEQRFRAIGLSYANLTAATETDVCGPIVDEAISAACYAEVHNRHAWGVNDTTIVPVTAANPTVGPGDSVNDRLVAALNSLLVSDPGGSWGAFLDPTRTAVLYDKVIIVGWSFGAGLAGHLGTTTELHAAVLIDGVKNRHRLSAGVFEPALMAPSYDAVTGEGTYGCRLWGVYNLDQNEVDMLRDQWTALGMPEDTSWDGETVDGSSTDTIGVAGLGDRRFYTDPYACNTTPHESFTLDASMFKDISTCTVPPLVGAGAHDFQLKDLYSDILCQATAETCTY